MYSVLEFPLWSYFRSAVFDNSGRHRNVTMLIARFKQQWSWAYEKRRSIQNMAYKLWENFLICIHRIFFYFHFKVDRQVKKGSTRSLKTKLHSLSRLRSTTHTEYKGGFTRDEFAAKFFGTKKGTFTWDEFADKFAAIWIWGCV